MKFETTTDLLDAMRERGGFRSDNEMADGTDIPQSTMSSWRHRRTFPTEIGALKIADFLEISPALVLAIAAADRLRGGVGSRRWRAIVRGMQELKAA